MGFPHAALPTSITALFAKLRPTGRSGRPAAFFILIALAATAVFASTSSAKLVSKLLFGGPAGARRAPSAAHKSGGALAASTVNAASMAEFQPRATLAVGRQGHTATLLDNGDVLLAGGDAGGTAELFHPGDGTFTDTASLLTPRADHTATKLADGRVLITGGRSGASALASTEIYNPATAEFQAGPALNAARAGHSATLLPNGDVLILGGDGSGSAEVYKADSRTFTFVSAQMGVARSLHSVALMKNGDGYKVFIAGGKDAAGNELNSAEVYDPATVSFSPAGNAMGHHRVRPTLRVLPDGKVQIIGGNDDRSMEVYDPGLNIVGAHAHLIPVNDQHDAYLMGQDILSAPTRAALFHARQSDPLLNRDGQTITEITQSNKALVAGGADGGGNALSSSSVLNSSAATITTDKLDYQPGQTATVTGTGWKAGETVNIILHEDPHTHTERRLAATADDSGSFTATYLVEAHDLDVTFIAAAKGASSGLTAQTTFTDASNQITKIGFNTTNQPASFTVGVPNGTSVPLRVQTQNSTGNGEGVTGNGNFVTVQITSNSATGRFDTNNAGTYSATSLTLQIVQGFQNTPDFFYRDTVAGSVTLTATVTATNGVTITGASNTTATLAKTVNKANTTTAVTSSPNPSDPGQSVTFTATVAHAAAGGTGSPTGTVTFKDGATTLGTGTLSSVSGQFQATFSTSSLSLGAHSTITAVYGGDSNFNTSTSANYSHTVNKYPTTTSVTGSPNPSNVGDSVTFTIHVTDTAPVSVADKTGTVTLRESANCSSGTVLGTDTLNSSNQIAHVTTSTLTAGSHNVIACYAGDSNYAASSGTTTQTVNAAAPTTLAASAAAGTYGGAVNLSATLKKTSDSSAVSGKTITFTLNGASVGTATTDASGVATKSNVSLSGINAGTYSPGANSGVAASFAGDSGFQSSNGTSSLTVTKATLTVTAEDKQKTYGDANPSFTASYTGFVNSETSGVLTGAPGLTSTATAASAAGTYTITAAAGTLSATNYSFAFVNGTLTVDKAVLTVKANDKTKTYGDQNPSFDAAISGFKNGEVLATSGVTGSADLTTSATQSSPVGGYDINAAQGTLAAANYSFTFFKGTLTVTKATLTVTAADRSKVYGTANPSLTGALAYTITGFVNGDAAGVVTGVPALSTSATASSNVGTYPITVDVSGMSATNYSFTPVSGTLTVTKAALTVTANNAAKIYGQPNPAFAASYSGFVLGQTLGTSGVTGTPSLTTAATAASPVGSYTITAAQGSLASANYSFTFVDGTLTITKAALTVTANNASRQYSDPNPTFTASYLGFVNGDTPGSLGGALMFATAAAPGSAPGNYPVTPSGLTSGNYNITFVNGTLTVTKEDARATYTGALYAATSSPTSGTATVTFAATIQDITAVTGDPAYDAFAGDIRNATVKFVNRDNANAVLCTAPGIGLVTTGDTKTGTATCNASLSAGNGDSTPYTIGVVVEGYYMRDASADNTVVTVSKPITGLVTGGGFLVLTDSGGLRAGDDGTKNNFGFNIRNDPKQGPKGNINTILRRLESDGIVHVYQIKGNAMTSLSQQPATATAPAKATFNGKANIQDITNPLNVISVDGNASLQVVMTDGGEPAETDSIAITLWDKNGGLWFASNWDGAKTVEQILGGGNIQVR